MSTKAKVSPPAPPAPPAPKPPIDPSSSPLFFLCCADPQEPPSAQEKVDFNKYASDDEDEDED